MNHDYLTSVHHYSSVIMISQVNCALVLSVLTCYIFQELFCFDTYHFYLAISDYIPTGIDNSDVVYLQIASLQVFVIPLHASTPFVFVYLNIYPDNICPLPCNYPANTGGYLQLVVIS